MSKLAMRRAWFQAHKWIGLILAVLIIPISLTGAALVWDHGLDRMLNPQRYVVSGPALLAPDAYLAAARRVLAPGERVATLILPEEGGPVLVAAAPAGAAPARPGPPPRTTVYLDPPTARVLDKASNSGGLIRTMHIIHGSLMVPGVGRQIVGWIGVAMLVSTISGIWLWWPTVGSWLRGLRWRRQRHFDGNLHHLFGFWIALPLFMLSLTGAWISFPQFFAALSGGGPAQGQGRPGGGAGGDRMAAMRARPLATPVQSVAAVIAAARPIGHGPLRSVAWPTERRADWTVSFGEGEGRPQGVTVADADGVASPPEKGGGGGGGGGGPNGTARLMRRLHDGTGMGFVWQTLIFVGGILPAVLAVTGIIMWWRARGWKRDLARRQRARAGSAAAATS